MTPRDKAKLNYCTRFWLIQERAGCTFLEARVYLRRERCESDGFLRDLYSLSEEELLRLERAAERKIREAQAVREVFYGYEPMFPDPEDAKDW